MSFEQLFREISPEEISDNVFILVRPIQKINLPIEEASKLYGKYK